MKKNFASNNRRHAASVNAAVLIMVAAALSAHWINASAQELVRAPQPVKVFAAGSTTANLERTFWICDHAATTTGMADIHACVENYEDLKARKFNGDIDAMVAWWEQNKESAHRALDALSRANAGGRTDVIGKR